jgi:hypothetical protein
MLIKNVLTLIIWDKAMVLVHDYNDYISWRYGLRCSYLVGYSVIWSNSQTVDFSKERILFLTIGMTP